jgi:predicted transcriptional regulator
MSSVEIKELRKEVKKYIDHSDERVLKMVFAMLEADQNNSDWWDNMPDEVRAEVEESMAQADRGEVFTHHEIKQKYPQWFTK